MRSAAAVLTLALLVLAACASTAPVTLEAETAVPITPQHLQVAAADRPLFDALHAHATASAAGFTALPYRRLGNFVEARWCSPSVREAACSGGSVVNDLEPGTAWFQLATLAYDSSWPNTFGVVWSAGNIPTEGVGVTVFFARNGQTIVGEGFGATVVQVRDGRAAEQASLGQWELQLGATTLRAATSPDEEARALLASVDGYRQRVAARLGELRTQLANAPLQVWHEGPYRGGGIPPERTAAAATPDEAAALRAEGEAELTRRERLLLSNADAVHAGLSRLFPAGAP